MERKKNGLVIANPDRGYDICFGEIGTPIFAKIGVQHLAVGIVVDNMPVDRCVADPSVRTVEIQEIAGRFAGNGIAVIPVYLALRRRGAIFWLIARPHRETH